MNGLMRLRTVDLSMVCLLEKNDTQAFIYVQKRLVKVFKEKNQQFTGFSILLYYYQEDQSNKR